MSTTLLTVPAFDLKRQTQALWPEIRERFDTLVANTAFIGGAAVSDFEAEFATFTGSSHAVGVGNGTDAIEAIFAAMALKPGDEVIVPAMSFIATLEPLVRLGLRPVLVDIDPLTHTLCPQAVERAITPRTRALLPVHLYGHPAAMAPLQTLANTHTLMLIEDAAQAHGASYHGQPVGALGEAAAFSFYPGKNLGAFGDAGAVTTRNADWAERIRKFCDHGRTDKYEHGAIGTNARLDAMQAAVLSVKLRHLPDWNFARQRWAALYTEHLAELPTLSCPTVAEGCTHVYHQYVVRTPRRQALQAFLSECGIGTGLHYPIPLHLQPACASLGHTAGAFPQAEQLAEQCVSLPMFPELTEPEVRHVIDAVQAFFRDYP